MTLTRCDLLFADRAILVEGTTERLLLPEIIRQFDQENEPKLGSQYLSIMEVGGAYAHRFFKLLDFLNLRTLVITDLDTINAKDNQKKCKVSLGTHSSNACINSWFTLNGEEKPTKEELLRKTGEDKIIKNRRIAFQIPHIDGDACGRSFEDAFLLANPRKFEITGENLDEREDQSWKLAAKINKTDFAMNYAILDTDWVTPRYIKEGLKWLVGNTSSIAETKSNSPIIRVELEESVDA